MNFRMPQILVTVRRWQRIYFEPLLQAQNVFLPLLFECIHINYAPRIFCKLL